MQKLHRPLPQGGEAVHSGSSTAHCAQAVWQYIAGIPMPERYELRRAAGTEFTFGAPKVSKKPSFPRNPSLAPLSLFVTVCSIFCGQGRALPPVMWLSTLHSACLRGGTIRGNSQIYLVGQEWLDKSPRRGFLDQEQVRAPYAPLFWGRSRSITQGIVSDAQPLVKSSFLDRT